MTIVTFMRPRLTGARFDEAAVPLELLKDLAALEELIIEVAKAEFLKDNPDRQRSPRGFTRRFALKLTGIEEGSAIPVIGLAFSDQALFPPKNQVYFERAREAVTGAISAAATGEPIVNHLPEKALGYFDKIGRSLRDGEAIEFPTSADVSTSARLTKETRRRLLMASSRVTELTEETSVRGRIPEVDQDDMTFEVQLVDGRKVKCPITAPHLDAILETFNNYKSGAMVLLQGIARFSRTDRLLGFESIDYVNMLDPLDVSARLEEFKLLKNGWLEGEGKAPSPEGLTWLSQVFEEHYPDDLDLPHIYPTPEGGVQAEWRTQSGDSTLEIDLTRRKGDWHFLDLETDQEVSLEVELDTEVGWNRLIEVIREMKGTSL